MKAKIFTTVLFLGIVFPKILFSQIFFENLPYTSTLNCPDSIRQAEIPAIVLPVVNNDSLRLNDSIYNNNERYGEVINVNINVLSQGSWTQLEDGSKLCRLKIISVNAYSLSFNYNNFWLPSSSTLHIYNHNRTMVIGAFTEQNNTPNNHFATQIVEGDTIILEYHEAPNTIGTAIINIAQIIHDYRNIMNFPDGPHGSSDLTCHINVACPEGLPWENEIRSVGLFTLSGITGSGALINNVREDGTPYFLTAFHCIDLDDCDGSISSIEESSVEDYVVIYFNHEAGRCNDNTWHDFHSLSGCTYKSASPNSDFALLQLNTTPYSWMGVHYAGWSRENIPATSGACIHHPGGDIKKISIENDQIFNVPYTLPWAPSPILCPSAPDLYTPANSHWRVTFNQGVTEGGSSGSPFFDQNHRIVGQLHGGPPGTTCTNVLVKYYGKISTSWDGDGTPETRLKDYLDPDGTGATILDGWDNTCISNKNISETINSGTVVRSAHKILTATSYTINPGADVTFIAGEKINVKSTSYAKSGSKFHAYITPVDLECNPPPTVELLVPTNNTAPACVPWIVGANYLHGKKPYQYVTLNVAGQEQGFQTFTFGPDDVVFYMPTVYDDFAYNMTITDFNGITSLPSNLVGYIYVFDDGLPCSKINHFDSTITQQEPLVKDFLVYPNPSDGNFSVAYEIPNNTTGTFEVYNMMGENLFSYSLYSGKNTFSISRSDLSEGIYFYRAIAGNKQITADKIIIIK